MLQLPNNSVAVKICGITREEDAIAAIAAGTDLLGFNTWTGTKRHVDLFANASWISTLPVLKVALLVNASLDEARKVAELPWIDALQLHGDEDEEYCRAAAALGKPIIKALRAANVADFAGADRYWTEHILLDAHVPGAYGGTGSTVNVEVAKEFSAQFPKQTLWLAGGLKPENVASAIAAIHPRVVDVSSGVESEPARKDPAKMRAFVDAARQAALD